MYAIVKSGGKQYRVERGQTLLVERLAAAEGAELQLEPLLYRSDEAVFDKHGLQGVKVTARVVAHVRGEKLRVFKFKPKRGYKRRTGHRQDLTRIEVLEISAGAGKAKAGAGAGAKAKAPAEGKAATPAEGKATAPAEGKGKAAAEGKAKAPAEGKAKAAGAGGGAKAADEGKAKAKATRAKAAKADEAAEGSEEQEG